MHAQVVQGYKFNIFYPDLIDKSKVCTAASFQAQFWCIQLLSYLALLATYIYPLHTTPPVPITATYLQRWFSVRTQTPKYFMEPADSNDFCIIRFSAGPPYEDIAFKVVKQVNLYNTSRHISHVWQDSVSLFALFAIRNGA